MGRADLHLHTTASDGTWQPAALVDAALATGLSTIAVTDHDTVAGVAAAIARGREVGVRVIPGVELSVRIEGDCEIHVLGLGIDVKSAALHEVMDLLRGGRADRVEVILQRLSQLGLPVNREKVTALAGDSAAGRPHIARAMVEARYVNSVDEAFHLYLGEGRPAYVPHRRVSAAAAIDAIHAAGGVAVWAHPGLVTSDSALPMLCRMGLDGLEVWHSRHTAQQADEFAALARQFGLLASGGSDCHGPGIHMPPLLGTVTVDDQVADSLLAACRKYRGSDR